MATFTAPTVKSKTLNKPLVSSVARRGLPGTVSGSTVDPMADTYAKNQEANQQTALEAYQDEQRQIAKSIGTASNQAARDAMNAGISQQQAQATAMQNAANSAVNPDPMANVTVNNNKPLFDPSLTGQYNNVISGMLTGSAYDPMKQQNNEAMARAEAQQRANAADQVNRFGGVGQGIGSQIANATESNILQNRFNQNLKNAVATEELKQKGLNAYNDSINAEQNRFNLEQSKYEANQAISGDFASYVQNATDLKGATAQQIAADQGAMNYGQQLWESQGGTGKVSADWVKKMVDRVNDPVLNDTFRQAMNDAKEYFDSGLINQEEYDALTWLNKMSLTGGVTRDKDGNYIMASIETSKTENAKTEETQKLQDEISSGVYTVDQIRNSPERVSAAEKMAVAWSPDAMYEDPKGARNDITKFKSVPDKNVPFKYFDGNIYMRTSDVSDTKWSGTGQLKQTFTAVDIKTGKTVVIDSSKSAKERQYLYENKGVTS